MQDLSTRPFHNIKEELFHVSFDPKLPKVLKPEVPASKGLLGGVYPETDTPRVCFSNTIRGALRATYANWQEVIDKEHVITFHLYRAKPSKRHPFILPQTLAEGRAVHDALVTGEHVTLQEVAIEYVGKYQAAYQLLGEWMYYRPYGDSEVELSHTPLSIIVDKVK